MRSSAGTESTAQPRRRGVVALAFTAVLLSACGGGMTAEEAAGGGGDSPQGGDDAAFTTGYSGPPVELAFWNGFTGADGPFMEQMIEDFEAQHENIDITNNTIVWGDFYQRVPAAVNAGEGPDVGVMHMDQLATNAARGVIVPVGDIAEGLGLSAEDFTEEVWNAGIYQDERYGIPLDVHSLVMYYNKDHFEEAGITEPPTDEASFMEALDKLQAAGHEQPFWMPNLWPAHIIYLSLAWQNGGEVYADDGSAAYYDAPENQEAAQWQRSIIEEGYSPADIAIDAQYQAFKNGENSITWDGIWWVNDLEASDMNYGIAPLPAIFEDASVYANSHNFFITKQATEDPNKLQAAQVFIGWMSENSGEWAKSGMIPARQSVRETAMEGLPHEPIAEAVEDMRFLPSVPGLGGVQAEVFEPALSSAILGRTPVPEAMESAATRATELLKENLERFGGR